ncbi:hypothetical protein P3S67_031144 [Capsicum chacoense]
MCTCMSKFLLSFSIFSMKGKSWRAGNHDCLIHTRFITLCYICICSLYTANIVPMPNPYSNGEVDLFTQGSAPLPKYCLLCCYVEASKDWCCQVCDKDKGVMSSLLGRENEFSEGSMLHACGKIHQSTTPPSKHNKFPGCRGINWEKKVKIGKTKYLSVEEVLSLPSSLNKYGNPLNMTGSSRVVAHPCDPALAHSWKGSFDIIGAPKFAHEVLNNCIHAYPPSRVRRKVYEFCRLLPDTLKFKLVSRGVIWNDLFNNHFSGKDDIGLYFIASERERLAFALYIYLKRDKGHDVEVMPLLKKGFTKN